MRVEGGGLGDQPSGSELVTSGRVDVESRWAGRGGGGRVSEVGDCGGWS